MPITRIVCLANSRKLQGRCVAGRELVRGHPGAWIRPVSSRPSEEVSEYERQYEDGSDPRVLDIVDVPLLEARPNNYQQENWLLDPRAYWTKVGRLDWGELRSFAEPSGALWLNGHSTYHGRYDYVLLEDAVGLRTSLKLVHVFDLRLVVFKPGEAFGNNKRRVQAWFTFSGNRYGLWVTDPLIERAFLARPDAGHELGEAYLTISIGEPFENRCYKLVAAVIRRP